MDDLINIIVPVYNTEKYLKRCLDSVFNQTYKNIFVYLVNDGSTDGSFSLLEEYHNRFHNSLLINQANKGPSSARNEVLKQIKNISDSYVMFIDSDDYIDSDYCDKMISFAHSKEADIVCSNYIGFDEHDLSHKMFNYDKDIQYDHIEGTIALFKGELLSHPQMKLYKGYLWKDTLFNEERRFMEDQELLFKIFYKSKKIYYFDYLGYHYFYSDNSQCRSAFTNKKVLDALKAYYEAIIFPYKESDKPTIVPYAKKCFAAGYLMLLPRFYKREATSVEKKEFSIFKKYVNDNRLIKEMKFDNQNDKKKRLLYLISSSIYILLYRLYIYRKEKRL